MKRVAVTVVVLALVALAALMSGRSGSSRQAATVTAPKPSASPTNISSDLLVRADTRYLSKAPAGPTLVEFLDFECESCRAMYPFIEQLRTKYDGRLSFAVRYFPLPGHKNSMNAALAVEAAAQQGKFEPMVSRMYTTQRQWGEKNESQASLFRTYAQELGLNLAQYDTVVAAPATKKRIEKDIADGKRSGVSGTPTFFINGRKIQADSADSFIAQIDAAL